MEYETITFQQQNTKYEHNLEIPKKIIKDLLKNPIVSENIHIETVSCNFRACPKAEKYFDQALFEDQGYVPILVDNKLVGIMKFTSQDNMNYTDRTILSLETVINKQGDYSMIKGMISKPSNNLLMDAETIYELGEPLNNHEITIEPLRMITKINNSTNIIKGIEEIKGIVNAKNL